MPNGLFTLLRAREKGTQPTGFPPIREFREIFEVRLRKIKGKQGVVSQNQGKNLKSGNFFQNHFQPFKPFSLRKGTFSFKWGGFTFGKCICNKLMFL